MRSSVCVWVRKGGRSRHFPQNIRLSPSPTTPRLQEQLGIFRGFEVSSGMAAIRLRHGTENLIKSMKVLVQVFGSKLKSRGSPQKKYGQLNDRLKRTVRLCCENTNVRFTSRLTGRLTGCIFFWRSPWNRKLEP